LIQDIRKMRRIFKIENAQLTIDNEGCFAKAKLDYIAALLQLLNLVIKLCLITSFIVHCQFSIVNL